MGCCLTSKVKEKYMFNESSTSSERSINYNDDDDKINWSGIKPQCHICMGESKVYKQVGEPPIQLDCGHRYHICCYSELIEKQIDVCPLCHKVLPHITVQRDQIYSYRLYPKNAKGQQLLNNLISNQSSWDQEFIGFTEEI
jgi:hypothetical protein